MRSLLVLKEFKTFYFVRNIFTLVICLMLSGRLFQSLAPLFLKELDKKLSGKLLIWLFSAELIYCDCSTKIQNKFLILEISLCTFF